MAAGCWSMRPPGWSLILFFVFFWAHPFQVSVYVCECECCVLMMIFSYSLLVYFVCGGFVFVSCVPFLRLRHSRLFISNFISYEFVCFYRAALSPQKENKQESRNKKTRRGTNNKRPPHPARSSLKPAAHYPKGVGQQRKWFILPIMKVTTPPA